MSAPVYRCEREIFEIKDPALGITFSEPNDKGNAVEEYRSDGTVFLRSWYREGHLHGLSCSLFSDGTVASERWFYEGKAHGRVKEFSVSGTLIGEYGYVQGALQGEYRRWYPNGVLQMTGFFCNGLPDGRFFLYHTDGLELRSVTYRKGRREGFDNGWLDDGYLLFCEQWRGGTRQKDVVPDVFAKNFRLN